MWRASDSMKHLVRNADGDQLLFIHLGEGEIYCDFGRFEIMSCFREEPCGELKLEFRSVFC